MNTQIELDRLKKEIVEKNELIKTQKDMLKSFNMLSNDLTKEKTDLLEIINNHSDMINDLKNEIYFLKEIVKTFIKLHDKIK